MFINYYNIFYFFYYNILFLYLHFNKSINNDKTKTRTQGDS